MTDDFAELWLVVWVCGGLFVASSITRLLQSHGAPVVFDATHAFRLLGSEAFLAIAFVPLLHTRGWTVQRVTAPWESRDIVRAVAIFSALYAIELGVAHVAPLFGVTAHTSGVQVSWSLPWLLIASISALNPIFEEFLYLGYVFNATKRYGAVVAATSAVCLRVAIHAYQGPGALVQHVLIAVVLTVYYARTRRLWPVIMAHGILDIFALGAGHLHGSV
jgi:membrane protease YdiL (CAAX protease family)